MKKFFALILSLGLLFCFTGCEEPGVPNPFPGTWINEEYGVKVVFTDSSFTAYYLTEADEWEVQKVPFAVDGDGDGAADTENPADRRNWTLYNIEYISQKINNNGFETLFAYVPYDARPVDVFWWTDYFLDKDDNLTGNFYGENGEYIENPDDESEESWSTVSGFSLTKQ
jgi:hypothetical protein